MPRAAGSARSRCFWIFPGEQQQDQLGGVVERRDVHGAVTVAVADRTG
jgi:hypothetical protein